MITLTYPTKGPLVKKCTKASYELEYLYNKPTYIGSLSCTARCLHCVKADKVNGILHCSAYTETTA